MLGCTMISAHNLLAISQPAASQQPSCQTLACAAEFAEPATITMHAVMHSKFMMNSISRRTLSLIYG